MRTITRTLTVAGSVAAAIAVGGLASAHAAGTTLSKGHVDVLDVEYDGLALDLHVHDESVTPDVEYAPADVVLQALPARRRTPSRPAAATRTWAPRAPPSSACRRSRTRICCGRGFPVST
ncbi:hypothetical protein ABZ826_12395 [Streptomyces sp. NPDC047515]|uniref:hypothetical protein n=1 Tax=Streptomyces sp. NPDC047515 TaxID=3155380 RepID=UPI0033ECEBE5